MVAHLSHNRICPLITFIAVVALPAIDTPWVTHLNDPSAIAQLYGTQERVGMPLDHALVVSICIKASMRADGE